LVQMTSALTSTTEHSESLWNLGGLTVSQLRRSVFDEIIANNVFGHAAELCAAYAKIKWRQYGVMRTS
jgi:hypothetical protein